MKWVHPQFLFALAVLIIPLLIHLFHFKRYKTVFFSSLTFLKAVEQNQKSARKLKYWLIFTSRALAFIFLVFAFAQPYFPNANSSQKAGIQLIGVYVDNSFSMSRIGQNGELISQAKELARSIIDEAPRNAQFVLFTNELSGNEKQVLSKAQFLDRIEQINNSPLARKANEITRWWKQLVSEESKNEQKISLTQLVYLSDFQKSTFGELPISTNWETPLYPIVLAPQKGGNLYIDSIWFETPIQKIGAKQTVYAIVKNESDEEIKTLDVNFKIGNRERDVFADVPAFGSDTVELSYFNNDTGTIKGMVTVNDKQMNADDSFYFSYTLKKTSSVLIIDGEDAVTNCSVVYQLDDFYQIISLSEKAVQQSDVKKADLVVLNGLNQIPSNISSSLVDFADEGGTVLLFPGTNCATNSWNAFLQNVDLPLISSMETSGLTVRKLNLQDPFFNGVFEKNPTKFALPSVGKAYRTASNSSSKSIDLMTFQNGSSFVVKGTGKKNVFFCTTSLSKDFSSFTSNQLFSTLLLRIGELSQRNAPLYLTIGSEGFYPISQPKNSEIAIHLRSASTDFIPNTFSKKGVNFISVTGAEASRQLFPGNYTIESGDEKLGVLALNTTRLESKVDCYSEKEVGSLFEKAGIKIEKVSDGSTSNGIGFINLEQSINYWKWCVIAAILFLLAEMLIVLRFKK